MGPWASSASELICEQRGALIEDLPPPPQLPSLHKESSDGRGKKLCWVFNHLSVCHLPGRLTLSQGKSLFSGGGGLAWGCPHPGSPFPSPSQQVQPITSSRSGRCFQGTEVLWTCEVQTTICILLRWLGRRLAD